VLDNEIIATISYILKSDPFLKINHFWHLNLRLQSQVSLQSKIRWSPL